MTSRMMWAPKEWKKVSVGAIRIDTHNYAIDTIPVIVTSAEGMPDFKPGDRVRVRHRDGATYVDGYPYKSPHGGWWVPLTSGEVHHAEDLTKLPREVTKLLRVTGPESAVAFFCKEGTRGSGVYTGDGPYNVRVEIVEEESKQ